ncbi:DUF5130 family protein [Nocardioides mangrovi]|uniref:DUF5130 domain-containing protein n=1 Tax=Nocardioides mangrovi TaxID=2874580 RepID=A0ABS7U8R4_9ACTN|nr:DUF5130 family protein [Nocardioides mangrovi]MBZ5737373.1 DUF5130 domain-containing protein [Nocardioides mangrovi]
MGVGEFNAAERFQVEEAIRAAEQVSRFEFSVFVGRAGADPRAFATQLHNKLVAPPRSILIMLDPAARALEVVTGGVVRRSLSDQEVELTTMQMQSSFAAGDLVGGLRRGIQMLAEHAAAPETLHAEQP